MGSSFQVAYQRYIDGLSPEERQKCQHASLQDFVAEAQSLQTSNVFRSRAHRFIMALDPLVQFLSKYASAVDTIVQYDVNPSAIVWGSLKALLVISDSITFYEQYEKLFNKENGFRMLLADVYFDIFMFLRKAKTVCEGRAIWIFIRGAWKSFETHFRETLQSLSRHRSLLEAETILCHRKHVELDLQQQASYRQDSSDLLQKLVVCSSNQKDWNTQNDERKDIISWLAPVDSSEDLSRLLRKRTPNTGKWILDQPIFLDWLGLASHTTKTALLWVYGAPGSGKTMLSASIVDWLESNEFDHRKKCVCYFHCDYRDTRKMSLLAMVRSLVTQMIVHMEQIPQELRKTHDNATKFGRSSLSMSDRPLELMKVIGKRPAETYLVIDGLDECEDPSEVANTLKTLAQSASNIRVMCVSRDSPSIKAAFQECASLKLTPEFVASDIDKYLKNEIENISHLENSTKDELFTALSARADGMFLWAHLMVEKLVSATSTSELSQILNEIPLGLNQAYQQVLESLDGGNSRLRGFATTVLSWICCSERPMTVPEIQDALSWDDEFGIFSEAKKPFRRAVVGLCRPLIEHLEVNDTLRLVHLSVRDFLCGNGRDLRSDQTLIRLEEAHRKVAEVCIEYLCLPDVAGVLDVNRDRFPFADYASLYWCQHLVQSRKDRQLYRKVMQLMSAGDARRTWIRRYMRLKRSGFPLQELVRLQKSVTDWMHAVSEGEYAVDDLADLQHFLFDFEKNADKRTADFGSTNFERVLTIRDLAREYTRRGRLDHGVDWLTQCLAAVEQAHGPSSVHSTWLLNSLGILYDQQDNTGIAVEVQTEALRIQEAILPHDHLDITLTVNELGRIYRHMGKYKESEEMHLRALAILQTTLSNDDLQIIWTQNTLARNYLKQDRIPESIKLHEQALAGQQRILGKEHPHALWTLTDLARCYGGQGDFAAALALQNEVVDVRVKVLGVHHTDTLWSMNSVGLLLEKLGRWDESRYWHTRALEGQTAHLGTNHKHTVWSLEALKGLPLG